LPEIYHFVSESRDVSETTYSFATLADSHRTALLLDPEDALLCSHR
jgi:hypothetical protein